VKKLYEIFQENNSMIMSDNLYYRKYLYYILDIYLQSKLMLSCESYSVCHRITVMHFNNVSYFFVNNIKMIKISQWMAKFLISILCYYCFHTKLRLHKIIDSANNTVYTNGLLFSFVVFCRYWICYFYCCHLIVWCSY